MCVFSLVIKYMKLDAAEVLLFSAHAGTENDAARQLFSHFHFISSRLQMLLFSAQDVQISYGGEDNLVHRAGLLQHTRGIKVFSAV